MRPRMPDPVPRVGQPNASFRRPEKPGAGVPMGTLSAPTGLRNRRRSGSLCSRHRTDPPAGDRDHVTTVELRATPDLHLPVHPHLVGLDELARVRPVLGETGQLEELAQPDRQLGDGNVLDR